MGAVKVYAVTGSSGFVGSHLVERLRADGHGVQTYDRRDRQPVELSTDPLDFSGLDGVFHLAAQPGVASFGSTFPDYVRDNLLAAERVFEAAAHAGVRVVFASSSTVYGEAETLPTPEDAPLLPSSPYGVTKVAGEHLARACAQSLSLDVVTVRLFTVYGPRQRPDMAFARIMAALRDGSRFKLHGDGKQARGFTFVSDAVEALLLAMEVGEGTYNVGGGELVQLVRAISLVERFAEKRLRVDQVGRRLGDERRTLADTTRIRALGWSPKVALVNGLRAQWEAACEEVTA